MQFTNPNPQKSPLTSVENPMESGWYRSNPWATVAMSFLVVIVFFGDLPERIPDFKGPDSTVSKYTLWVLPVVNLLLVYFMGLAGKMPSSTFNYPVEITPENAAVQRRIALTVLAWTRALSSIILFYLTLTITLGAVNNEDRTSNLILLALVVIMLGGIGYFLWKARRKR